MNSKLPGVVSVVFLAAVLSMRGQTAGQEAASKAAAPSAQRALLDKYCIGCHNARSSNGLALDAKSIEVSRVGANPEKFEKVVRKLRAGMMPPSGAARPDPSELEAFTVWLENELDGNAVAQLPAPGIHR